MVNPTENAKYYEGMAGFDERKDRFYEAVQNLKKALEKYQLAGDKEGVDRCVAKIAELAPKIKEPHKVEIIETTETNLDENLENEAEDTETEDTDSEEVFDEKNNCRNVLYLLKSKGFELFYHTTSEKNVSSIKERGLLPRNVLKSEKIGFEESSNLEVQERRSKKVEFSDGTLHDLHDSVCLYLLPSNDAVFALTKNAGGKAIRLGIRADILLQPDIKFCISYGNAARGNAIFITDYHKLKKKINKLTLAKSYVQKGGYRKDEEHLSSYVNMTLDEFKNASASEILIYPKIDSRFIVQMKELVR